MAGWCLLVAGVAPCQEMTQQVRGSIADVRTGQPLAGVAVALVQGEVTMVGTASDDAGRFVLQASPGRYRVVASHVGYQSVAEELLVIAGKESVVHLQLIEMITQLEEVSISAAASNPSPGATDITIEKTLRVPANFFDPLRMAASLPGMVAANDQGNALSVKGYSPNALLWKLEGLDIVNPNHLANAGTLSDKPVSFGGGVSILSSQVLDKTSVYSGWLPASYGNALSAVVDMGMRAGNKSDHEFTTQASLIGLDVAAEGPLSNSGKSSYLANYRYSTVGLLSSLGLDFGDEQINFQDLTFHLDFEQSHQARLSVFGFAGLSANRFQRKQPKEWETEKDRYNIDFEGRVFGAGFMQRWGQRVRWQWGSSLSGQFQERTAQSAQVPFQHIFSEAYNNEQLLWSNRLSATVRFDREWVEAGVLVNYLHNDLLVETITPLYFNEVFPNLRGTVAGVLAQPYINHIHQFQKPWRLESGLRYVYFGYNETGSLEPRFSLQRQFRRSTLSLSYSKASQWQQAATYLAEGNRELKLNTASQFLLQYNWQLTPQSKLSAGAYWHELQNVPSQGNLGLGTLYSSLNQWDEFIPANLTSNGTGRNRGVELAFEKSFDNRFYLAANGSVYQSTYSIESSGYAPKIDLDTRFNGGFTSALLAGKEWGGAKRSFGVHLRMLYLGGLRQRQIDVANSIAYGTTQYAGNEYVVKLPDYWRPDLRVAWRKNKPGYTRTLSIDIQNVASYQNVAYYYFDTFTQQVEIKYQLGIIPVLVYRVDF